MNLPSMITQLSAIWSHIGVPGLVFLGVLIIFVLIVVVFFVFRLLNNGMRLGREQRLGNWYYWKK